MSLKWSHEEESIILGCSDSCMRMISSTTGEVQHVIDRNIYEEHRPFTGVCWRPAASSAIMKNVFIGVNSGGMAVHCHATSSKIVHELVLPDIQFH